MSKLKIKVFLRCHQSQMTKLGFVSSKTPARVRQKGSPLVEVELLQRTCDVNSKFQVSIHSKIENFDSTAMPVENDKKRSWKRKSRSICHVPKVLSVVLHKRLLRARPLQGIYDEEEGREETPKSYDFYSSTH